ncbi:malonyl-CoA O-methyltransferase [Pasteurella testudinis DSM 23072]|uniref:Malonyl-[acyl-carrier protein] O-methyltransferase n=1 Tax=Pasteurella testudinis DSM 23072 TaxID=1122938 RepID=A0A1W1UM02_9PAST|nr:malonyl-ACP O-methyltransferase BioC [Pasteurella testudinis]SMB82136.1 malonyl-CoA O-methyltransferase [Pasteurella testudinis DSM 23072]SUB52356.1 biotin synthesis protein BioC [Pasteurella testudinis]
MPLSREKLRIQRCFAKALPSYDQQARAQAQINRRLCQMLAQNGRLQFERVLEIGCGSGGLTRLLAQQLSAQSHKVRSWQLNDLNPLALQQAQAWLTTETVQLLAGDAEYLTLDQPVDLLASASTVQWFSQPQRFIRLAEQALKPQGLLLFSTFLPDNLIEIKQLTQIGLNYPDKARWLAWLQPHFELLALDCERIVCHFTQPSAVLRHLKATGVTATNQQAWTKGKLADFYQRYQQRFGVCDDENHSKVRLTYAPLLILAKRK